MGFKARISGSMAYWLLAEWRSSLIGHPGERSVLTQKGPKTEVGRIKRG
jgi:hypothetical protein